MLFLIIHTLKFTPAQFFKTTISSSFINVVGYNFQICSVYFQAWKKYGWCVIYRGDNCKEEMTVLIRIFLSCDLGYRFRYLMTISVKFLASTPTRILNLFAFKYELRNLCNFSKAQLKS